MCPRAGVIILSHPDFTVGSGVTPDRLCILAEFVDLRALAHFHYRYGIAPILKNKMWGMG